MNGKLDRLLVQAAAMRRASSGSRSGSGASRREGPGLFARLADLYARMETAYNECSRQTGLSCSGCPTNCCTSYFRHHTYIEWSYLWRGLSELPEKQRALFTKQAELYVRDARQSLAKGVPPTTMCPLNAKGLCALYPHRLMICRMHGTRNTFRLPDGGVRTFPGCARCSALWEKQQREREDSPESELPSLPTLDRTPFYAELADLEREFTGKSPALLPRVDLTLAEMIVMGPPRVR